MAACTEAKSLLMSYMPQHLSLVAMQPAQLIERRSIHIDCQSANHHACLNVAEALARCQHFALPDELLHNCAHDTRLCPAIPVLSAMHF